MLNRKWKIRAVSFFFVTVAGVVLFKVGRSIIVGPKFVHKNKSAKISGKNEFSYVVHTSFDKDSKKVILKSSKVKETNENILNFSDMITTFNISPEETATIFADQTHFMSPQSKQAEMRGNVKLSTNDGLLLKTEKSFVDLDEKTVRGDADIFIDQDDTKFFAKSYHFDMKKKIVTLIKNVKGNLANDLITADKLVIEFEKVTGKDFKSVHSFGNSSYKTDQYNLKANKEIIYKKEYAEANGNVDLDFLKNNKKYHVNTYHLTMNLKDNVIEKVTAHGNLIIKVDDSTTIKGTHGILENDLLTVSGNTVITNEKGNILCEKAILNTETSGIRVYNSKGIVKRN